MAQRVFWNPVVLDFTPVASTDPYTADDAFGAVIDLTAQIGPSISTTGRRDTFMDLCFIVTDMDKQHPELNLYFSGEDLSVDIPDNAPFLPAGSDAPKLMGPYELVATGWKDIGSFAKLKPDPTFRVPVVGTKLLAKVVIKSAATFTSLSPVRIIGTGYIN
jgi:hypothetical protein